MSPNYVHCSKCPPTLQNRLKHPVIYRKHVKLSPVSSFVYQMDRKCISDVVVHIFFTIPSTLSLQIITNPNSISLTKKEEEEEDPAPLCVEASIEGNRTIYIHRYEKHQSFSMKTRKLFSRHVNGIFISIINNNDFIILPKQTQTKFSIKNNNKML